MTDCDPFKGTIDITLFKVKWLLEKVANDQDIYYLLRVSNKIRDTIDEIGVKLKDFK